MPTAPEGPILVYHGGRWEGTPEVQRGRAKRTEHGPGIYFTTALETARKYAKGGGTVKRATIAPNLRWIGDAKIPLAEAVGFVRSQPRMKNKAAVIADLERNAARLRSDTIDADVLVNLGVNHDALVGDASPAMARFLVDHGVDASLARMSGNAGADEDWLVIFNPRVILSVEEIGKNAPWDLPLVRSRVRR
jgi:hypothetical protein